MAGLQGNRQKPLHHSFPTRLPVEIQELVIDALGNDKLSLQSCSLVCKAWSFRAYRYLWKTLIASREVAPGLRSLMERPHAHLTISPHIRKLHVIDPYDGVPPGDAGVWASLWPLVTQLSSTGKVCTLILEQLDWSLLTPPARSSLATLGDIQFLEIRSVVFPGPKHFARFLADFPHLRSITLINLQFSHAMEFDNASPSSPLAQMLISPLCSVALRGSGTTFQKDVRLISDTPLSMDTRRLVSEIAGQMPTAVEASSLFKVLGPGLQELDIRCGMDQLYDNAISTLDLGSCSALHRLNLSCPTRVLGMIPWIPWLLSSITSNLQILQIAFQASRNFNLDARILMHMARVLTKPPFEKLRALHFVGVLRHVDHGQVRDIVANQLKEVFRSWDEKGTLRITFLPATG